MRNIFRVFTSVKTQISILILAAALLLTVAAGWRRADDEALLAICGGIIRAGSRQVYGGVERLIAPRQRGYPLTLSPARP